MVTINNFDHKHHSRTELPDGSAVVACTNACPACAIEKAVADERERCARIAEASVIPGHNVQAPSCAAIAKRIREGKKPSSMKGYVIVSQDEKSIFGREDADFYGAIWFYPDHAQAQDHCGPAGRVIEIDVTFPDDVTWSLAAEKKVDNKLGGKWPWEG